MASRSAGTPMTYGKLYDRAEVVLTGPYFVQVDNSFWGEPNLALRCEPVPRIHGVVRSRRAYANLCALRQEVAILREAVWDARAAFLSGRFDAEARGRRRMLCPELSVRYAWVEVSWLQAALESLRGLRVPLDPPDDEESERSYTLAV